MMNALDKFRTDQDASLQRITVYKKNTDRELWRSFKAGDKQAFETIFRANYQLLFNYGLKFSNSEDDVKDAIQILFSKLWEKRDGLGDTDSIKSYLLASLRRMILRGSRNKFKFTALPENDNHTDLVISNIFFSSVQESERSVFLAKLVNRLPKRQKEAVYLKFYQSYKFNEVAEIMGITTRVVYKLIYKAMRSLGAEICAKKGHMDVLMD